jgi:hypothetical protein
MSLTRFKGMEGKEGRTTHISRLKHPGRLSVFVDLVPITQTNESSTSHVL